MGEHQPARKKTSDRLRPKDAADSVSKRKVSKKKIYIHPDPPKGGWDWSPPPNVKLSPFEDE